MSAMIEMPETALDTSVLFGRMNQADEVLSDVMVAIPAMSYDEALETGRWAFQHGNFAFLIRGKIESELSQRDESKRGRNQFSTDDGTTGKKAATAKRALEMGVDKKTLYDDRRIYEKLILPKEKEDGGLKTTSLPEILPRGFYRAAIIAEGHEEEVLELIKEKADKNPNYTTGDAWKDAQAFKRKIDNPAIGEATKIEVEHRIQERDWREDLEFARSKVAHIQEQVRYGPLAQYLNTVILVITQSLDATKQTDKLLIFESIEEGYSDPQGDLLDFINHRDNISGHVLISQKELNTTLDEMVSDGTCRWVVGNLDGRGPKTKLISINE